VIGAQLYHCNAGGGADADALKPASATDIVGPGLFAEVNVLSS